MRDKTRFPTTWGQSRTNRFLWASNLSKANISSHHMVAVDDGVVKGLYATKEKKRRNKKHEPMRIGTNSSHKELVTFADAVKKWRPFGASDNWTWNDLTHDRLKLSIVDITMELRASLPSLMPYSTALEWSLSAYLPLIHVKSPVSLKKIMLRSNGDSSSILGSSSTRGQERKFHFGIYAREDIPSKTYIYELLGLMASDTGAPHSNLSVIMPHPDNSGPQEKRIMAGPLRFVNHVCDRPQATVTPNIQWVALKDTAAFVAYAHQAIPKGSEMLADYGIDYFDDELAGCPCAACKEVGPQTA